MRIVFSQSGGFVGIPRVYEVDTAALPAPERVEIEGLVAASDLAGSWERTAAAGRDLRRYEIRVDGDGPPVHVCCDERCLPEAARPLVAYLAARAAPPAPAGRRWGRFDGRVVASWHDDGRTMTLTKPFAYIDSRNTRWPAPGGSVVDGASIPRPFWSLIGGPFTGRFRNASVVHDVACETRERPWRTTHRMFYEACRCGRVAVVKAKTMYWAVHHFGPRWRVEERRTLVAGRTVLERVVHDETPPPPSAATVAAAERYFATHDVDDAVIPELLPEMVGDGG